MLLAAMVSALIVVADQLIDSWADGDLLAAWVVLWVVGFAAVALLAEQGYEPEYGARPLRRVLRRRIENPLATHLLEDRFRGCSGVLIEAVAASERFEAAALALAVADPSDAEAKQVTGEAIKGAVRADAPEVALEKAGKLQEAGVADGDTCLVATTAALITSQPDLAADWLAQAQAKGARKDRVSELEQAIERDRLKVDDEMAKRMALQAIEVQDYVQRSQYALNRYGADSRLAQSQLEELTIPTFGLGQRQYKRELEGLQLQTREQFDSASTPYRRQEFFDPLSPIAGLPPTVQKPRKASEVGTGSVMAGLGVTLGKSFLSNAIDKEGAFKPDLGLSMT
jgi:hypothetical protein